MDMTASDTIAIAAALLAVWSAISSHCAAKEAKKSNDIGRLNALLAFRVHYLNLMQLEQNKAEILSSSHSGMNAIRSSYADLDQKLREVNLELEAYHKSLVSPRT